MRVHTSALPLHEVSEQVHNLLLEGGPVLDDGVSLVRHLLLKLFQFLDLLPNLELGLSQGRDPECCEMFRFTRLIKIINPVSRVTPK